MQMRHSKANVLLCKSAIALTKTLKSTKSCIRLINIMLKFATI